MEETTSWQVTTIGQGERLIRRSLETVQRVIILLQRCLLV